MTNITLTNLQSKVRKLEAKNKKLEAKVKHLSKELEFCEQALLETDFVVVPEGDCKSEQGGTILGIISNHGFFYPVNGGTPEFIKP